MIDSETAFTEYLQTFHNLVGPGRRRCMHSWQFWEASLATADTRPHGLFVAQALGDMQPCLLTEKTRMLR